MVTCLDPFGSAITPEARGIISAHELLLCHVHGRFLLARIRNDAGAYAYTLLGKPFPFHFNTGTGKCLRWVSFAAHRLPTP